MFNKRGETINIQEDINKLGVIEIVTERRVNSYKYCV